MEPEFFYNDVFYHSLEDFIEDNGWDQEYIKTLPEDFKLEVLSAPLEPIVKLSADWILNSIDEERFSEENYDGEFKKILKILNDNIDFEKINSLIPSNYYGGYKYTISKNTFLEALT